MGARSVLVELEKDYRPPDLDHLAKQVLATFECIRLHEANRVIEGGLVGDPTTGSSQLTGTGNTDWNANIAEAVVCVGGVVEHLAAAADFDVHSGSFLTGLADGSSCIAAIVAKNVSGTVTIDKVVGTPAVTGSQVAPTDAEITAAIGASNPWVKIAEITLNRTGDTTVTESQDNGFRPVLGVNVPYSLGDL